MPGDNGIVKESFKPKTSNWDDNYNRAFRKGKYAVDAPVVESTMLEKAIEIVEQYKGHSFELELDNLLSDWVAIASKCECDIELSYLLDTAEWNCNYTDSDYGVTHDYVYGEEHETAAGALVLALARVIESFKL